MAALASSNENIKLELPRAWEPLDSSKPSQACGGLSSHGVLSNGDRIRQGGFGKILWRFVVS